jgi:hypothetical protein
MQAVRKGYHGVTPVSIAAAPRHPLTIARELYSAAECLEGIAEDFAGGAIDERELSAVDRMLVGMGRLIMELRIRQGASSEVKAISDTQIIQSNTHKATEKATPTRADVLAEATS